MKKTIVVADDFENSLRVIKSTLQKINCNILPARNGKDALKFFDGRKIDLLVTDYYMPEMDGMKLVQEVKKIEEYNSIPILVLTTETMMHKKKWSDKVKVTAWIRKPYDSDVFLTIIKKCLHMYAY